MVGCVWISLKSVKSLKHDWFSMCVELYIECAHKLDKYKNFSISNYMTFYLTKPYRSNKRKLAKRTSSQSDWIWCGIVDGKKNYDYTKRFPPPPPLPLSHTVANQQCMKLFGIAKTLNDFYIKYLNISHLLQFIWSAHIDFGNSHQYRYYFWKIYCTFSISVSVLLSIIRCVS